MVLCPSAPVRGAVPPSHWLLRVVFIFFRAFGVWLRMFNGTGVSATTGRRGLWEAGLFTGCAGVDAPSVGGGPHSAELLGGGVTRRAVDGEGGASAVPGWEAASTASRAARAAALRARGKRYRLFRLPPSALTPVVVVFGANAPRLLAGSRQPVSTVVLSLWGHLPPLTRTGPAGVHAGRQGVTPPLPAGASSPPPPPSCFSPTPYLPLLHIFPPCPHPPPWPPDRRTRSRLDGSKNPPLAAPLPPPLPSPRPRPQPPPLLLPHLPMRRPTRIRLRPRWRRAFLRRRRR